MRQRINERKTIQCIDIEWRTEFFLYLFPPKIYRKYILKVKEIEKNKINEHHLLNASNTMLLS